LTVHDKISNIIKNSYKWSIRRPAISQASCRKLPAFLFDYWLTCIGDKIAGNYGKIQADILFWNICLYMYRLFVKH